VGAELLCLQREEAVRCQMQIVSPGRTSPVSNHFLIYEGRATPSHRPGGSREIGALPPGAYSLRVIAYPVQPGPPTRRRLDFTLQ